MYSTCLLASGLCSTMKAFKAGQTLEPRLSLYPCHTLPLLQPFTTTTGMYWVIINFLFNATNFLCMCNQQLCLYDPGVFSTLLTVHFGSVLPITSMGGRPGRCAFLFYFPCFEGNSVLGPFLTHTRHAGYLVKCRTSVSTSFH